MAIDKRKTLESARRYAQRGAREKALAQYESLLRGDPRDAKLRLEIGDVHQRWGRTEEAITHYARVADQFRRVGFEARAVAVWKRILNLDAKRNEAHVALSDLYLHLGMQSQSIKSLQAGIDGLYGDGRKREALELLRRMGELDPTNATSRLKVAALLAREGMKADAVKEYEQVATEFERIQAWESIPGVYERLLAVNPDRPDIRLKLCRAWFQLDDLRAAETSLEEILAKEPEHEEANELLCEVYEAHGRSADVAEIRRRLAGLYRERGDEEQAREMTQRLPMKGGFGVGSDFERADELGAVDFGSDDIESADFGDAGPGEDGDLLEIHEDDDLEDVDVSNFDFGSPGCGLEGDLVEDPVPEIERASQEASGESAFEWHDDDEMSSPPKDLESPVVEIEIGTDGQTETEPCDEEIGDGALEAPVGGASAVPADAASAVLPSLTEDLEEAAFYVEQELYDGAEAILQRVLVAAPGHPTALVRLGEIAAARGEDPGHAVAPMADVEPRETAGEGRATAEEGIADGSFDLASELREELDADGAESRVTARGSVLSVVDGGMAEIFADFKRGVAETLSASDIETRYDLGIAYREMELFEDAMAEFRACLEFVERRVDSLHMLALCCVDAERPGDAVTYLEQALSSEGLGEERRDGLNFELGRVCELLGDSERARSAYEAIEAAEHPGRAQRLAALDADRGNSNSAETLRGKAEDAEGYESFDDLVIECETGTFDDPIRPKAEGQGDPIARSEIDRDPESVRRRRARKISFV